MRKHMWVRTPPLQPYKVHTTPLSKDVSIAFLRTNALRKGENRDLQNKMYLHTSSPTGIDLIQWSMTRRVGKMDDSHLWLSYDLIPVYEG